MAREYKFIIGSDGEIGAGIVAWSEDVTITFSGMVKLSEEEKEDETEYLRSMLTEMTDGGYCMTESEYKKQREAENSLVSEDFD